MGGRFRGLRQAGLLRQLFLPARRVLVSSANRLEGHGCCVKLVIVPEHVREQPIYLYSTPRLVFSLHVLLVFARFVSLLALAISPGQLPLIKQKWPSKAAIINTIPSGPRREPIKEEQQIGSQKHRSMDPKQIEAAPNIGYFRGRKHWSAAN